MESKNEEVQDENSEESYLTPEEEADLEKKKAGLSKAAETNKLMLEEVESRIMLLKNYMEKLEMSHEDISRVEFKLGRLAQMFNRGSNQ